MPATAACVTRRQMRRSPSELAARVLALEAPGDRATWLCEAQPMVWIPYDDAERFLPRLRLVQCIVPEVRGYFILLY